MSVPDFCVLCEYTLQVSMNTILTLSTYNVLLHESNWCLQEGCNSLYVCNERPQEKRKSVCATSACKKDVSYTGLVMQEVVQIHHNGSTTTSMYLNRCHLHHHRRHNHHHLQPKLPHPALSCLLLRSGADHVAVGTSLLRHRGRQPEPTTGTGFDAPEKTEQLGG